MLTTRSNFRNSTSLNATAGFVPQFLYHKSSSLFLFFGIVSVLLSSLKGNAQCSSCPCVDPVQSQYSICAGGNVTIQGKITFTSPTIGYIAEYVWKDPNNVIVKTDTLHRRLALTMQFVEYTTNSIGNYSLEVRFRNSACTPVDQPPLKISFSVTLNSTLSPSIKGAPVTTLTCTNPSTVLSLNETFPQGTTIEWTGSGFSVTSPNLTVTAAGTYSAKVTTPAGCTGTASININSNRTKPNYMVFPTDYSSRTGLSKTISMAQGIPSGHTVNWQRISAFNVDTSNLKRIGTGNLINELYTLSTQRSTGLVEYRATLKNTTTGCESDPLIFRVKILSDQIFIPEIISPNNDGANDNWNVVFPNEEDKENHEVHVFNRLGIEVYSQDNMVTPWNTNNCPNGVYFYMIINKEERSKVYKGALTILGKSGN